MAANPAFFFFLRNQSHLERSVPVLCEKTKWLHTDHRCKEQKQDNDKRFSFLAGRAAY